MSMLESRKVAWSFAVLLATGCTRAKDTPEASTTAHQSAPVVDVQPVEPPAAAAPVDLESRAKELAQKFVIIDGHVDVPHRLTESRGPKGEITEDIAQATAGGDFDYVRAKQGGLDVPFMSIYVPSELEAQRGATRRADELVDMVEGFVEAAPDKFAIVREPSEIAPTLAAGKIALAMGMENGAPIAGKLENLRHFHERGIRYITLTHAKDNHISDSSYDKTHTHRGLSSFGKSVVAEMNRLGVMVDVSHISDDAFWQVMEISRVPVIASHSSCRHFTPGFERNMSDDMIRALAKNGGVIQINFGSAFISGASNKARVEAHAAVAAELERRKLAPGDAAGRQLIKDYYAKHPLPDATVDDVADHIDHVVKLVGVDHVGLGSDFDGVNDATAKGLDDVAAYPNLIRELLERGYADSDIEKICGTNVLRVWTAVAAYAKAQPPKGGDAPK